MHEIIGQNLFWFMVAPFVAFVACIAMVYCIDRERHITLSQCVGKTKLRSLIFAIFIMAISVPIYLILFFYIGPSRGMTGWFQAAVVGMIVGQIWLLLFPHKENSFRLHKVGANLWAAMVILSNALILFFGETTLFERIFLLQFVVSGLIVVPIIFFDKLKHWTFALETFAFVNWAATLLVLTF